jgi:ATPase family associated with various cellular activities (AAA)
MSLATEARAPSYAEEQAAVLAVEIAHVHALLEAYRDGATPPPEPEPVAGSALERVAACFGLTPFERRVLVLAAAVELDGRTAQLAAAVQGATDPRPTFGLALAALLGAHWDAVAPDAALRRWGLVELGPGPTLAARALNVDERILHELTGMPTVDHRLRGVAALAPPAGEPAPSHGELARELAAMVSGTPVPSAAVLGGDDLGARAQVAEALARAFGLTPLSVRAAALAAPGPELADQARLIDRETVLGSVLAVVEASEGSEASLHALLELLRTQLVVVLGPVAGPLAGRAELRREVRLPAPAEQRGLWARALGGEPAPALARAIDDVSHQYRLGTLAVEAIARELPADAGEAEADALRRLCRTRSRAGLDDLAERLEVRAAWGDLVLPTGHLELLREIARHVRHRAQVHERWGFAERTSRGLGVAALFAGDSGTGKTLAAEVLAADLELDLYRIDLSATVSKYIGETEKNLRRLFDAAETSGAVLLFDEADALFGKRGEVKDGHDRYANLEVAYLLQRMESYRGLAILTTNLRGNVDQAFTRRLRFTVQFPFPEAAEREAMWRLAFPAGAPVAGLEAARLAALPLSGAAIRSIALSAAFGAAADGGVITRDHVRRAAQLEFTKAERPQPDYRTAGLR